MKVSVVIPTYNGARAIRETVESVLSQTAPPAEVLIVDDGSTDDTISILNSYGSRVTVFQQRNQGVASARNTLCRHARGDLVAFLDSDDVWHPRYLETQSKVFREYPDAVAFFTGHVNFYGFGKFVWNDPNPGPEAQAERISTLNFLRRYHTCPFPFASMSFCCIPKRVLNQIGADPFCAEVSGSDDFHLLHLLPLLGSIVYTPVPLVAYRITRGTLSTDRRKLTGLAVRAMELAEKTYKGQSDATLSGAFSLAFASKRREYAKVLMGGGEPTEARRQLRLSLGSAAHPISRAKSIVWLLLTYLPRSLQPRWFSIYRESEPA